MSGPIVMPFMKKVSEIAGQFIFSIKTDNAGTSGSTQFTVPSTGVGYDYTVEWESNILTNQTAAVTLDFSAAGTYDIKISGAFPAMFFNNAGDKLKMIDIKQWGVIVWGSFFRSFFGCANMIVSATDTPDLSLVTTLSTAFANCTLLTINVSAWDISTITSLQQCFQNCLNAILDVSSWDTSSLQISKSAFQGATSAGSSLNLQDWDISNLTDAEFMCLNITMTTANYDQTLIKWEAQTEQLNVKAGFGNSVYTIAVSGSARSVLTGVSLWIISDGGGA